MLQTGSPVWTSQAMPTDTYTYDYNGNLTQMDRYYPTPLLNSSTQTDKTTENTTENRNSLLMTHYPSDYLPSPENKWSNL